MITVYRKITETNDETIVCQLPDENADLDQELMGKDEVSISLVTDRILPIRPNDYIRVDGNIYRLNREPEFGKKTDVEYSYSFIFEGFIYELLDKVFIHPMTNQSKFTLTGTLRDFLNMLVENISLLYSDWKIGTISSTDRKNIVFDSLSCREVLNKLKDEYKLEYYLTGKTINYADRVMFTPSLSLNHGRSNGLYSIEQQNIDSEDTVTRAYIYGGTKNLPPARPAIKDQPARPPYRNGEERLRIEERYLEDKSEYHKIVEKDVFFDDVFPHLEASVESVEGEFNRIIHCSKIDFDITQQAIGGTKVKINFLTGDLMGIPFELNPTQDASGHSTTINLVRKEDETALPDNEGKRPLIPNDLRKVKVGDKFNFTDIIMPDSYVKNAEDELRRKGQQWLDFYKQLRVKYKLTIDHRHLRKNKLTLGVGKVIKIIAPDNETQKSLRIVSLNKHLKTGKINCDVTNYDRDKWDDKKIWKPYVDINGNLSWNLSYDKNNLSTVEIKGNDGFTWKPIVNTDGLLKWEKDSSTILPEEVNIKGAKGDAGLTWKPELTSSGELRWTQLSGTPFTMKIVPELKVNDKYELVSNDSVISRPLKGDPGVAGPIGPQGLKGDQGVQGLQGLTWKPSVALDGKLSWSTASGTPTEVNIKGPTGATGAKGDPGVAGPIGPQGLKGDQGVQGLQGLTWKPSVAPDGKLSWSTASGTPTEVNIKGPTGATGAKGDPGVTGPIGPQGSTGKTWKPVLNGSSLTWTDVQSDLNPGTMKVVPTIGLSANNKLMVDNVEVGTSLKGATGPQGLKGDQGVQGLQGLTWKPSVAPDGKLSWSTASGTPTEVNIKDTIVTRDAVYNAVSVLNNGISMDFTLESELDPGIIVYNNSCSNMLCYAEEIFRIPLATTSQMGLMSSTDKQRLNDSFGWGNHKLGGYAKLNVQNYFNSGSSSGDLFTVNGFMVNQWAANKPAYTMYTNLPNSLRGWLGMGMGENEDTILFGHCNWNQLFTSADIVLKVRGSINAKGGTFSEDVNALSITTPTILHPSGNLKIGNPTNSAYVEFVEDTKFTKSNNFSGNCTFSGANTFTGNCTFSGTNMFNNHIYTSEGNSVICGSHTLTKGKTYSFYLNYSPNSSKNIMAFGAQISSSQVVGIGVLNNTTLTIGRADYGTALMYTTFQTPVILYGNLSVTGSINPNYGSDRRLKENITKLTGASELLKGFSVYEFDYTDEAMKRDVALPRHTFGLMHDEVADTRLRVIASVSEDGFGGINYNSPALCSMMLASLIEQINRFDKVETTQSKLENKIKTLEKEVKQLKSIINK